MLHGLSSPWKQPVAYEFTAGSWSSSSIKQMILRIIKKVHEIGLYVESATMDMGGGNQGILHDFGIFCTISGPNCNSITHPEVPNEKLVFFADVPHLLKNLRNHLIRGQIIHLSKHTVLKNNLPTDAVDIKYIKQLLDIDEANNLKLVPGLNRAHLNPDHFKKMKVLPAKIVLGRGTAAALRVLVDEKKIYQALTTAWFCEQVSQWYDLMTSHSPVMAISQLSEAKHKTAIEFLYEFMTVIKMMNISEDIITKSGKVKRAPWKPIQRGILISTQSTIDASSKLLDKDGFKYVMMAAFSQDGLENLFSVVRSKNPIPTALEFKNGLRIICLSQLLKTKVRGSYEIYSYFELPKDEKVPTNISNRTILSEANLVDQEEHDIMLSLTEDMQEEDWDDFSTDEMAGGMQNLLKLKKWHSIIWLDFALRVLLNSTRIARNA